MSKASVEPRASRSREVLAAMTAAGVFLGSFVLAAYIRGDKIYPPGSTVDDRLEWIIKPRAVRMAKFILRTNKELNNGVLVTDPGTQDGGAYTVTLNGFTPSSWVHVTTEMYRGANGLLDPNTVNDVDITVRDCLNDGSNECGGPKANTQEIELIYGDSSTFTQGDWGVEDTLTPVGYNDPTIDITTRTKSFWELATLPDAQKALNVAKVFSKEAATWIDEINSPENSPGLSAPKPR